MSELGCEYQRSGRNQASAEEELSLLTSQIEYRSASFLQAFEVGVAFVNHPEAVGHSVSEDFHGLYFLLSLCLISYSQKPVFRQGFLAGTALSSLIRLLFPYNIYRGSLSAVVDTFLRNLYLAPLRRAAHG